MGIRLSKVSGFKYHGYKTYFWIKTKFGSRSMQIGSGTFRSRTKSLYVFQPSSIKTDPRSNPPWFLPDPTHLHPFLKLTLKRCLKLQFVAQSRTFECDDFMSTAEGLHRQILLKSILPIYSWQKFVSMTERAWPPPLTWRSDFPLSFQRR